MSDAPRPSPASPAAPRADDVAGSLLSTVSGPAIGAEEGDAGSLPNDEQRRSAGAKGAAQRLAAAMPANPLKAAEHGLASGLAPQAGAHAGGIEGEELATASTVTEGTDNDKLGDGVPTVGFNPGNGPLDRVRVDSRGRALTSNQGVPVADNQNSLKAGLRGPTLLEDFLLVEKIQHFDHERIPERVVHARGSAAHGFFECYESQAAVTRADLLGAAGKRTPVFVRFSTVAGERGSMDTARDTRGFATKFYTDEGVWDLVGNNIPVFFIQDAMKFPDVVHAVKPEPHHGMPQASSAHDTFWDFVSLMPESMHHVLWVMSDRGIPRSYRTMQGFGVNTYRLVNAEGVAHFVKFHWLPKAGTHSLVWDEAAKLGGADPDFHRRDLWEAIEAGDFPEYELALQVIDEDLAAQFSFDILDPTKLVPEELVPLQPVGRMVLDRNPDNFFAETEQVAFCVAHVVPGIDFSNDPLLQGRIFSYQDTQLTRLGGPNFHEIPINASVAQVHNHQRDGLHRQGIARGRVAYEPNSLAGGCPHQAGMSGFVPARERMAPEDKVRAKPEKFADHYSQAQLFWRSQTEPEKRHIVDALRFELSRCTVPAVRLRVVSQLRHVDDTLAQGVAEGLGMTELPPPQPLAVGTPVHSEVEASPGLSLFARPGTAGAAGRRVALLAGEGIDGGALRAVQQRLLVAGAVPRVVGLRLGRLACEGEDGLVVETTIEAMPSVLWDALVLPDGAAALAPLAARGAVQDFLKDQYRHGKPILALGETGRQLLAAAGIPLTLADGRADPGLVLGAANEAVETFVEALARHRHFDRELESAFV